METIYTKEYFIKKFEAIPSDEIGRYSLKDHCILHHVGVGIIDGKQSGNYYRTVLTDNGFEYIPIITLESEALVKLFGGQKAEDFECVYTINDGINGHTSWGKTPKERILNKLRSL